MEVAISVDLHIRGRIACRRSASKTDRSLAQHSPSAPSSALQIVGKPSRMSSVIVPASLGSQCTAKGVRGLGIVDLPC